MKNLSKEIGISLLHRSNKDVDVQMIRERQNFLEIQSFHQKARGEVDGLVNWVISNMPKDYKSYKISISHGGTELYPVYTKLTSIGANVSFNN